MRETEKIGKIFSTLRFIFQTIFYSIVIKIMSNKKKFSAIIGSACSLLVLVAIGYVLYNQYVKSQQKITLPEPEQIVVRVYTVGQTNESDLRTFPGFAKEARRTKASFRIPGELLELNATLGVTVKEDDVLAKLDPRDFQLAVERLEHSLDEANAVYTALKTGARAEDVASLKSQLEAAKSSEETAKVQFERMANLLESQTASKAMYDKAKMDYDVAKAARESLENQLEKATTGARPEEIEAAEAKIAGIQTSLKTAKNALEDTVLKAPFDGVIVQKFVENHEVIVPGQAIVELSDAQQIEVAISIPESVLIRESDFDQDRFLCSFEAFPGKTFPAKIKEIGSSIQLGRQSYPMTLTVSLPDSNDPNFVLIRPNMAATITLAFKRNNPYYVIPQSSIVAPSADSKEVNSGNTAQVMLYDAKTSTVTAQTITIHQIRPEGVEVESGLKPGDVIVSAGARFLESGQKVKLESSEDK